MADQGTEAATTAEPGHSQNPDPQAQQAKRPQDNNATFLRAARAGNLDQVLEFLRNGININTSNSNGLNALHLASKEGHNEVVRELIRRNADVDAATRKGNTALHIASLAGQDIIVTILVENGANVNAQSTNGFTPLYMAAQENHEAVVRYLLAHNANQALATEDGFTPLAVALQQGHDRVVALLLENDNNSKVKLPALHIAAKKDDTRAAGLLLQSEQNPNVTSKSGFTPLHISAHYGNENVAQLLIEKGANVNYQARHNISPLHVAAKWGRVNLVKLLLQNGAVIDCRTRDLLTPLHCAARSGHELVVDLLLEQQAPIGAKTKNGLAPLHMAAQGDHVDCARNLLYHQAPVDDVTVDYLTPLHVAAHCGHVQAAKLLLDRHADPNALVELLLKYYASLEATTESGLSPLHVASFMGCISIVIYLIQQGAKVDVETVRGETPLHLAARANQTDIVRVLVRNGAKVDAQARELQTPLHIASRLGNTDIVHILLNANADPNAASRDEYTALHIAAKEDKEEVAQILLDHKANKSALTRKGFTPLHLASKYGNYNVAKLLLEGGTPVDIEGKNQVTPLHVAAHYNNDRVAQLLLENGAFAQATAKNGYTPLHIAAKKNQMDIASALLSYKADPNATSKAGFTPLHLASESGHTEMSGLLIENGSMVNARANNGLTPLHLCAQEDNVDAARVLLSNRAEVNAQTKAGYTPLHVACHFGQLNMVRLLIEHGALVSAETTANYTPLHQAAQQGHNSVVRYLLEHGASPNSKTVNGQTPLSIAQRLGYVSVVETLKTVTETTVITETTTVTEERYKPQNPERMNETMFSDSEDEVDETQASAQDHARDFNESITQGLHDSAVIHLIHTGEQMKSSAFDTTDADLDAVIKRAQAEPVTTAIPDPTFLDQSADDNVLITRDTVQPSFLISFLVDARGGAMRGCRHSGVRVIIPPRKAAAPMRITCRYLRKEKLAHPPPLSEGEALASRILEMGPHSAKFLGPVVLEVPHFASLRGREREIVILRSDDGQHWKEHQLEATEDAVQEVLNESFDAAELQQLDDLHSTRITRILTNDFPMYFAVVTRVRQEVHCVGPEGGVILSSVVPRVQAIFPDGSLTKTIKVSLQAQPIPHETVVKLHGNRVAVSPIVTVEPRRRKFHKPITLCIPLPQSGNKGMLTQYANGQPGQEPPTLRLLCSITGGSSPAQWEDITGTTQLTFTGEEVSFTTTFMRTPFVFPYMAKFVVFARRPFPIEGQLRLFCMTDDREDKTLEKQEGFIEVAKSRDVEVLSNRHQFLEFAGNLVPITKSGDQLSVFFLPFQENRLGFNVKVRQHDDQEAATTGRIAIMKEARIRAENIPPQHPICTLSITLPDYRGQLPPLQRSFRDHQAEPIATKYAPALSKELDSDLATQIDFVTRKIGGDWMRMSRSLGVSDADTRQIKREMVNQEPLTCLKIWSFVKGEEATIPELHQALRRIGRDDIVHKLQRGDLDSDSLRLIDSSNLHLDRTSITSRDDVRAVDRSPAVDVQTTVTRTERYVHKSPESTEPVVDERTFTRVIRDNATVEEVVSERQALPLNEQERDHWMRDPNEEIEAEELFHNSREAMVINDFQETPDGFVETTTLVTQHVIPEAEPTAAVVPEVQAMEMREQAKTPQPSTHKPSSIVDEVDVESPSDKLPTPQRDESESAMETGITESHMHHEETPKAEPSSIERDSTPQHDDESPHQMQESVIVEETEEEHETSPAVASEPEPHLRGEGREEED
ncbi:hypothetical protein M3Y94_00450400 [Aphelenchoides besseyi]|nr:hypothetical protein M3Y94_00450400 [Aphelenchoides besseyi]